MQLFITSNKIIVVFFVLTNNFILFFLSLEKKTKRNKNQKISHIFSMDFACIMSTKLILNVFFNKKIYFQIKISKITEKGCKFTRIFVILQENIFYCY